MEESKLFWKVDRVSTSTGGAHEVDEELSTSSKLNFLTKDLDESLTDSYLDSISEGDDSTLVQQIPQMTCISNAHHSTPSPGTVNLLILASIRSNNSLELIDIINKFSHRPDSNYKWEYDNTFMHLAVMSGHLQVCEVLLDYLQDIQINAKNRYSITPLHLASVRGDLEIAQLLVRSGADLNAVDEDGNTPLHLGCSGGHHQLVTWLLSRCPDTLIRNRTGQTADEVANGAIRSVFRRFNSRTQISSGPFISEPIKLEAIRTRAVENPQGLSPQQFTVLQQIGKGSFGEVFLVKKAQSSELYAMKVLQKDKVIAQNLILYAMTERNILSQMHHPFMVSLHFAFQTSDKLFLVLDYLPGGDLASHLRMEKKFSESRARLYLCEILLALEELHRHDIIFRDLKPGNIVLDAEGHAVLTDFGLSKVGVDSNYKAKSFCGSLAYIAPEVINREGHGKAVDWYLLGVVFYEMIVGVPPYFSMHKNELFSNIRRGKLRIPSSISSEAKELIKDVRNIQLLQRDPGKRLGSQGDAEEIKTHRFFKGIDWQAVSRRELKPPRVHMPDIPSDGISVEEMFGKVLTSDTAKVRDWSFIS